MSLYIWNVLPLLGPALALLNTLCYTIEGIIEFGRSTIALCNLLQEERPSNPMEVLFVEHHIHVLRLAGALRHREKASEI